MPDGVRLSVTLTVPIVTRCSETFPVLLQYKPYRKDDALFYSDQSDARYLARRGFIVAQVDIRGTGSSEGVLVDREYSSQELNDCEQIIQQLANDHRSNGRVGMYGISWSGFNTLMMGTLRRPPALRALFAAHGTDDLYKSDIHYPDGIMHLDNYLIFIDHINGIPSSRGYNINEQWMKERFRQRPWIDLYLSQQIDGSFWKENSIKYAYNNLTLPVYLIGGLYDAYRDFALRVYEKSRQNSPKIKVTIGPFVHAMPENVNRHPGPSFDGKAEMIRWFNYWLKDDKNGTEIMKEPEITLFVRTGLTTGHYRYETEWPIARQEIQRMHMCKGHQLIEKNACNDVDTLEYRPWIGFEAGTWLGGLTGDQQPFDKDCLVYDSEPINTAIEIIGIVNVSLHVSTTARLTHWIVRLEDVDINGQVLLVTTGALNGAQRQNSPAYLQPNSRYTITFPLRFTTWTFYSGHRIRISVSNAMFPTYWPTPFPMNTSLFLNSSVTFVDLPVLPVLSSSPPPPPSFTQKQVSSDDILPEVFSAAKPRLYKRYETNTTTTITFERISYELLPNNCFMSALQTFNLTCSHRDPSVVRWSGRAQQTYVFDVRGYGSIDDIPLRNGDPQLYPNIDLTKRKHFIVLTESEVRSDRDCFYINFKRQLFQSNSTKNQSSHVFTFKGKHKRRFQ
ncbi:unnamed protein product [Rotaria sp. Silwood2]|nr:unnamed protein product [Rotaria sp. Silwood2]